MPSQLYDIAVIGGGINGTGVARDAAGRGYKTILFEAGDLAQGTSSNSTKLIHGGLRYLEYYEFNLVRKALKEREILMGLAPHIIWPMRFILPHAPHLRPKWMIRLGLYLYDKLAGRKVLAPSQPVDLSFDTVLNKSFESAFAYSDCWVEDSRLVVLNALDAKERGAEIKTHCSVTSVTPDPEQGVWLIETSKGEKRYAAKTVINAAGPWAGQVLYQSHVEKKSRRTLKLVKGSHIVVPKLYQGEHAYILQNEDDRIVFAIPYEHDYTLIGTTDVDVGDDPHTKPEIDAFEIEYLVNVINRHFTDKISEDDIVWTYSGVRPLIDDGNSATKASRDYELRLDSHKGLPFLSVLGGKLTTYRVMAEEAVDKIAHFLSHHGDHWTASEPLPGGDIPHGDFASFLSEQEAKYKWLPYDLLLRYARGYGTRMDDIVGKATSINDLGANLGDQVFEVELEYLCVCEWASCAEDVLWRRSKLGLHVSDATKSEIEKWFKERRDVISN